MIFSNVKSITIPEGVVTKIVAAGVTIWQVITESYKNWVPYSTTSDGTTIYNGTGYKYGYRIRSGGAESAQDNTTCTGFIPAKAGDVIRVSGCTWDTATNGNSVNVYDASFTNLGQVVANYPAAGYGIFAASSTYPSYGFASVVEESEGIWKWTMPPESSITYIRVAALDCTGNGSSLIVTVNQEITD